MNLFEAAAQVGQGGARGAAGRTGGLAGLSAGEGAGIPGAGAGAGANLDWLRSHPQFHQLRQIIQTQPRMLEPILQQIGAGNPDLARTISENPEQFLQLLSESGEDDDLPMPAGMQTIEVTPEEGAAIERVSGDASI